MYLGISFQSLFPNIVVKNEKQQKSTIFSSGLKVGLLKYLVSLSVENGSLKYVYAFILPEGIIQLLMHSSDSLADVIRCMR